MIKFEFITAQCMQPKLLSQFLTNLINISLSIAATIIDRSSKLKGRKESSTKSLNNKL